MFWSAWSPGRLWRRGVHQLEQLLLWHSQCMPGWDKAPENPVGLCDTALVQRVTYPIFFRINLGTVSDTAHPWLQFCQEGVLTVSSSHLGWLGLLIKKTSTPCPASPYRVLMCCSEAKLSNGPQCLFWLMLINWFKTSYFKDTDSLKVMLLSQGLLLLCFSNFINSPASLLSYFPIPAWRNLLLLLQAFSRENYWREWGAVLSVVLTATTVPVS